MNALRLYFRYAGVSIRSQLEYRASLIMQTIGMFLVTSIEFVGIWALFDRFGQVEGWTLPEIALFYGTVSIAWSICDALARGFEVFGTIVNAGDFDRVLLRPRSTVLQLLGHELTLRRIGRFTQGVLVLGYAISALELDWTIGRAALLGFAIAGGVCMFLGLCVLQATTAFWTTETLEVWHAFTHGGVTASQYPLAIYRRWFRMLFTFVVPLGPVSYFPIVAVLGIEDPLGTSRVVQVLAPLAGPVFLAGSIGMWRIGVRHYRSTGS